MKIKFTKLPTTDGTIKVSLDGGQSFTEHNIADIHESSIPLSDDQDYQKIKIKGPANILKNLDIVSSVKVEGAEAGSTNELSFIVDTNTYGFAFPGCVTGIIIPNGITTIGIDPNAIIPIGGGKVGKLPAKGYYSVNNVFCLFPNLQTVVIPESVTTISNYAFQDCSSLTSITIPDGVTSIGISAFQNCSGLTSITIPDGVYTIRNYAFGGCSSLTNVTIPNSVTSIGEQAFAGCSNLTSINIPDSVTSIGGWAFSGCPLKEVNASQETMNRLKIGHVVIEDGVSEIGSDAFSGCSNLTSVNIPDSVTSIGSDAFSGCSNLTSIVIPDSVTSINGSAFQGCSNLTSITIPESVTSICGYTFRDCTSLASITIPESVTTIGNYAFYGCTSLKTINYKGTEEQWNAIDKGEGWGASCPSDVVINYNYQG